MTVARPWPTPMHKSGVLGQTTMARSYAETMRQSPDGLPQAETAWSVEPLSLATAAMLAVAQGVPGRGQSPQSDPKWL